MNELVYPLTFEPQFRPYIWGGRNLETLYGRRLPEGIVAESWEISGHLSSPTRVATGAYRGWLLPDLLSALGVQLVGRNAEQLACDRFPLLVKLLDANQDLSLQVHPDDAFAREHEHGELGKTEMWCVLHAKPGAEIIYGLARGATRESFARESFAAALGAGALETQLHRLKVAAGDCVFIPAGTLHALLAGVVVAEIQENSDTTYRVYDWGRLGADGQPRPTHIARALQVINYGQIEPGKVEPLPVAEGEGMVASRLVTCPQFVAERVALSPGAQYVGRCDGSTFEIWGCIGGHCSLHWAGEPLSLDAVRFVLLPAALGGYSLRADVACTLLKAYVGEPRETSWPPGKPVIPRS
jgi:mannose-6-phosphate isomerase